MAAIISKSKTLISSSVPKI